MKIAKNTRLAALAAMIAASGAVFHIQAGTVRYVKPGGEGDGLSWATATSDLQAAIDASSAGDEVWVAKGIYKPFRLTNEKVATSYSFVLKDGVSLYGGFDGTETDKASRALKPSGKPWDMANMTVLSGDDDVPDRWERVIEPGTTYRYTWAKENNQIPGTEKNSTHVIFQDQVIRNHTIIDGFTITKGNANQHKTKASGGGVYVQGNVSLNACRFIENAAWFRNEPISDGINALGGAVFLNGAGKASVTSCFFARNYVNSSYTVGRGGGLFAQNAMIDGCVFEDCVGEDGGGGVYLLGGKISNSTISNCYASAGGGLLTTGTAENVEVYNCRSLNGGGINGEAGSMIIHAKVWDCYSDALDYGPDLGGSGGGIYLDGGTAIGCVVYNNMAFNGGGIYLRSEGSKAVSCTVQHNATREGATPTSNISAASETILAGVTNTIGNPDADAKNFTAPSEFAGRADDDAKRAALAAADWSLAAGSAFIDAGSLTPGVTETTDMAGNPRVMGEGIDVGAYEFVAEARPTAVLGFDGSKEEVTIGFRVSDGHIRFVVGEKKYDLEVDAGDKAVRVPLNGEKSIALYSDGLQRLNIISQGMSAIDISNAPALALLQADDNELKELDVKANPLLTGIYASFNHISSIDLSKNTAMRVLSMFNNGLSGTLDLSRMKNLSSIDIDNNNVESLLLPATNTLVSISCINNKLSAIDVAGRGGLRTMNITGNAVETLDLSGLSALEDLYAAENAITEVKSVADCRVIETFNVSYNKLTSVDISGAPSITSLYLQNNELESLSLENNPNIAWMNVCSNHIESLDVSRLTDLRLLYADDNEIGSIDLSNSPLCMQLKLGNNRLSSIDVSKLPALYWLKVDGNNIDRLWLGSNPSLSLLECGHNKLEKLDISFNNELRRLSAGNNLLSSIDISANPGLCNVELEGNNMDAATLNALIAALPDITGEEPLPGSEWISYLNISYMPGTAEADAAAAEAKGWRVIHDSSSGISGSAISSGSAVISTSYYTLSGAFLGHKRPSTGCYIAVSLHADGSRSASKHTGGLE